MADEKSSSSNNIPTLAGSGMMLAPAFNERTFRQKLADLYLVYELRTALYSLEPWEKAMFNSFLVAFLSMGCYTAYCFLPRYAAGFIKYFDLI